MGMLLGRIIDFVYRIKPYVYALLGIAIVSLLVLFFANDFFTQHFAWAPTRGEIVKVGVVCVLAAVLVVSALFALPIALVVSAVLALFLDSNFLAIFKVAWGALTVLIAAGFFLGKPKEGSDEKPQWVIEQERQELERQCRRVSNSNR